MTVTADRDKIARQHLDHLADAVRELELRVEAVQAAQHHPFPGLTVTNGTVSVVVLAGSAYFWRKEPEGNMRQVAPLDDPAEAARAVRKHLASEQKKVAPKGRHAHERAKD